MEPADLGSTWHQGRYWRRGITTGTCATAAAKGAALAALGELTQEKVTVELPGGQLLTIPLTQTTSRPKGGSATVIKDGGDDPDCTHGLAIGARVSLLPHSQIKLIGGKGVGIVTKPGLPIPPGEPAINPVPRQMILANLREVLGETGALVELVIPDGERVAAKTMNPQLGVVGGISIIGTTGIVEPMSEEAFKKSLLGRVNQIKAMGHDTLVLVPGKRGEKAAVEHFGLSKDLIALMSNFVGYILERAVEIGFGQILLLGHIGKLVKVAAGSFHTHNRVADGRLETMVAWLGILGAPPHFLRKVVNQPTTEGAVALVKQAGYTQLFDLLANQGEKKCQQYLRDKKGKVGLVLTDLKGDLLGAGELARAIGGELGWQISSR